MVKFIAKSIIKLERVLSDLDKFTLNCIDILKTHTKYVIVGGYTAILFGRTRGTEDIDVIVPFLNKEKFRKLCSELAKEGYWFINSENVDELYDLLLTKHGIRIALKNQLSPNIELKFAKDEFDQYALNNRLTVLISKQELMIGQLELQIAYKEEVLASDKDLEDSRHLRRVMEKHLNIGLINSLKKRLKLK